MPSKRLPDRVHVVRPPAEEYGGGHPLQSMGDHTREIVRALAQISDKLKRSEIERMEVLEELRETRRALAQIEDKTEAGEKAYLSLQQSIRTRDSIEGEIATRQARFENALKSAEDKLMKAVAGQALLDQKWKDTETRSASLHERIDEAVAHQTRLDRKVEAIAQDKSRMLRKVERLEEVVGETQEALKARAMVLLTDQSAGMAQGAPALKAPQWYNDAHENDNDGARAPWWRAPLRMQALGTASMVVAALLAGWMINHLQQPDIPQIAVVDGQTLARLNAEKDGWEPIVLGNRRVESQTLTELGKAEEQQQEQALRLTTPPPQEEENAATLAELGLERAEPVQQTPAPTAAVQEEEAQEQPFDYTNDEQLIAALEADPDALASRLNDIEPGVSTALELEKPALKQQPQEAPPAPKETAPFTNFEKAAFTQNPDIEKAVKSERGTAPLSDRAKRDPKLPDLLKDYEDQAIKGVAGAQHDLAAVYTAGRGGVAQDFERASFWFREAAQSGIANAAYNLGVLYHQGLGVERDLGKALYWYREAAKKNHPEAQYNLGIAYIEGIGTDYNPQVAAVFFERAAESGIMEAAYNLGLIFENGLLGKAQNEDALYWYKLAADAGSQEAKSALDQLAKKLQIGIEDVEKMVERRRAEQKSGQAESTTAPVAASSAPASIVQNAAYNKQQAVVAQIQERLKTLGLYPGPADGIMGPKTADAIRSYQAENGIGVTGAPSEDLLLHLMSKGL